MDYLELAIKAARLAGKIHKKYFQKQFTVKTKSSPFDLLTIADTEAEKAVTALIKKNFPEHNILAEENSYPKTESEYTWIIDPLDGTNNFASGFPIFCASVALSFKEEVIVGAVFDVTRNELFYAQKNKGAYLNSKPNKLGNIMKPNKLGNYTNVVCRFIGKRIKVSPARALKESIIITGFYYNRGRKMVTALGAVKRFLLKGVLGVRRLGAAALDLCYVASGRAAGFWEFELSPWDFAAGKLIIEEAGGRVTGRRQEKIPLSKRYFIVASNGLIHKQMLDVINDKKKA